MSDIDMTASISATRHSRASVVTASTDPVAFLAPASPSDSVCLESFVTWTGRSSMEMFVKVTAEDLRSGDRRIPATAFLTFVAIEDAGLPTQVPQVLPKSDEELQLNRSGNERAETRRAHRRQSQKMAEYLTTSRPW